MRILALDYGTKRIGVAVSDEGGRLARPVRVLPARGRFPDLAPLDPLVRELAPGEIVVGLPVRSDGSPGTLAAEVTRFAERVARRFGVPVVLRDEQLTTVEAAERLRASGARPRKREALIDAAAAAVLLQAYLDGGRVR